MRQQKKAKRPSDKEIIKAVQVLTDYGAHFRQTYGPGLAKEIVERREGVKRPLPKTKTE